MTKTKKNWSQILPKLFFLWQADLVILLLDFPTSNFFMKFEMKTICDW
jgi:hypothetical protein